MIARPLACPVFVGRGGELDALHEARREAARGNGRVVLIGGEAGVGKSRLLNRFLEAVKRERPRNVASAECVERAERPFGPFRDLVEGLGESFASLCSSPLERGEVFAAVHDFFADAARKRTTILTIEDLHWADRSSLDLLPYLAARVARSRMLIVATYRSDDIGDRQPLLDALARLWREPTVTRIGLDVLAATDIRQLLEQTLADRRAVDDAARDDIVRRCEGSPFFAEELLKAALEAQSRPASRLPISIRTMISTRFAQLTADERDVVRHAAVLGYRFEPALLAATSDSPLDDVLSALRRGCDLNIFVEEAADRVRFRFRHALMREVAYEGMLAYDARRIHDRVLRSLEASADPNRYIDALAHHAWAARDESKTVRYCERAGHAALELRALPDARACFERALEAATQAADQARIEACLALVLEMEGSLERAVEHYEAALVRYCELGSFDQAADVARSLATNRNNLGDADAIAPAARFLDAYGARVAVAPRDALHALLARLATIRYDVAAATAFLARIEAPERLPPRALQNLLIARMDIALFAGDAEAWRASVPSLFEATAAMPPQTALAALYSVAQSATWFALEPIAQNAFARASRIEERWDLKAVAAHGAAVRAMHAYYTGRLDDARAQVERAERLAPAAITRSAFALVAPLIAVALGDPALPMLALEAEIADIRRNASTGDDALVLAAAAQLALAYGAAGSARSDLLTAVRCTQRVTGPFGYVAALAARHLGEEDLPELRTLLAVPLLEHDVRGHANVALARAVLAQRANDAPAAVRSAQEAARLFRAVGWPLLEAWALEVAGDDAAARAIYARCGAAGHLRRLGGSRATRATAPAHLSEREQAVANAIARGATNAGIAAELSISVRTVEKHVSAILMKLGARNRSQIAVAFSHR